MSRAAQTAQRVPRRMADRGDAQVHATLALAAAVAIGGNLSEADMMAWREAAAYPELTDGPRV
jgi:hypothetical protein